MNKVKVVIIGSGPAAHTAAIYSGRAKLDPLMLEGEMAGGVAPGGQLTTTTEIENFPGFSSIGGLDLMFKMRDQSEACGTKILTKTVDKVDLSSRPFKVFYDSECVEADSVIIATGATAKRLRIKGEDIFWTKGISACAVCDGGLPIFRDKPLVVIGGGDTAVEEATYLTKYASKVTLLVRKGSLRASQVMQDRLLANDKIEVLWHTEAQEALGSQLLEAVRVINSETQEVKTIEARGLFYAIGHTPNTSFLENQLALDDTGYIITEPGTSKTSIEGIFACGDVQDKIYRQAVTAAGSGCMAALEAERFLHS
jgi:thioredoxin reductase (NADPH)